MVGAVDTHSWVLFSFFFFVLFGLRFIIIFFCMEAQRQHQLCDFGQVGPLANFSQRCVD